jgi:hypothetical protein
MISNGTVIVDTVYSLNWHAAHSAAKKKAVPSGMPASISSTVRIIEVASTVGAFSTVTR